jgi:hypothetical protein
VLFLIGQWVVGFLHHRFYVRNQRGWMGGRPIKVHKVIIGPAALLTGLLNVSLGFNLAIGGRWNRIYVPLVIVMLILLFGSIFFKGFFVKRRARKEPSAAAIETPRAYLSNS